MQELPSLSHLIVTETVAGAAVAFETSVDVDALPCPAHICEQFIDNFIVFKTFRRTAEAYEIFGVFRSESLCGSSCIHIQISCRENFASEIRHIAEYPFLAVETFLRFPGLLCVPNPFRVVVSQVDDYHLVVRNSGEHSLEAFRVPEIVLISESPSLGDPDGIGVACADGVVDCFSVFCKKFVFALVVAFLYRQFHLVETV